MIADLFRLGVFIASAATVGLAIVVVASYARVYSQTRSAIAAGKASPWRGLLPLHVTLIGLAYLTLVLASVVEIAGQVGESLTWRGPVYLVSNMIGAYALWTILGNSRYRQHDLPPRTDLSNRR